MTIADRGRYGKDEGSRTLTLRRLPRSVCWSTSSINGLGHTLASTPVLIKCATSTFCGNALRVLAIDSACSEDGIELWQEFF